MALTVIDVVYVVRGTISAIYLVDAAAEVVLIALWAVVLWRRKNFEASYGCGPNATLVRRFSVILGSIGRLLKTTAQSRQAADI